MIRVAARAATVRKIIALLNAVPITQPVFYGCPAFPNGASRSFSYRLLSAAGEPLAEVGYQVLPRSSPGPCAPMSVRLDGHAQPSLLGGPQVVEVQRMFGIPTSRYG